MNLTSNCTSPRSRLFLACPVNPANQLWSVLNGRTQTLDYTNKLFLMHYPHNPPGFIPLAVDDLVSLAHRRVFHFHQEQAQNPHLLVQVFGKQVLRELSPRLQ
jgi:hypothetical protein